MKNLSQAPPRLQRMILRIQQYDFKLVYRPGKELLLADTMSRANPRPGRTITLDKTIHSVRWSDGKLEEVRKYTAEDPELGPLRDVITQG